MTDEQIKARSDCLNEFCDILQKLCDVKTSDIVSALPLDVRLYRAAKATRDLMGDE